MRAKRFRSAFTLLVDMRADGLGIVMFLPRDTKVNNISRHNIRHKDHHIIYADKRFPFGCHILYLYFPINGQFFLLSRHN
jgi:hypothetical protein